MIITLKLSPQIPCGEVIPLVVERKGATITINGDALDLSFMQPGDSLPAGAIDHPLLESAAIERNTTGLLIGGLIFPISAGQTDPAACFPEPILVTEDGPIPLPPQFPPEPQPTPEPDHLEEPNADQH